MSSYIKSPLAQLCNETKSREALSKEKLSEEKIPKLVKKFLPLSLPSSLPPFPPQIFLLCGETKIYRT